MNNMPINANNGDPHNDKVASASTQSQLKAPDPVEKGELTMSGLTLIISGTPNIKIIPGTSPDETPLANEEGLVGGSSQALTRTEKPSPEVELMLSGLSIIIHAPAKLEITCGASTNMAGQQCQPVLTAPNSATPILHGIQKLPRELRDEIWKMAVPIIKAYKCRHKYMGKRWESPGHPSYLHPCVEPEEYDEITAAAPSSTVLAICRESRETTIAYSRRNVQDYVYDESRSNVTPGSWTFNVDNEGQFSSAGARHIFFRHLSPAKGLDIHASCIHVFLLSSGARVTT